MLFDFVNLTRTFETASSFAAFDFCAILSSVWHLDKSSGCVSSERDFFGGLEVFDDPEELAGGPPDSDDIVLTVLCFTLVKHSNMHK